MQKESLEKAKNEIINVLLNSNIDLTDKVELMINIHYFLNENKYEENIKKLKLVEDKWK